MSSISLGVPLRAALMGAPEVAQRVTAVFPVAAPSADLPYVVYYCGGMDEAAVKDGRGTDRVKMVVECYTAGYDSGVELAEAVREALRCPVDGMRGCFLADRKELWAADAYCQQLVFWVRG